MELVIAGGRFVPEPMSFGDVVTIFAIGLVYLGLLLVVVTSERRTR